MIGAAKTANREKGTCTPPIRVAINAITELTPKYGARVYLRELAMEMRKLEGVELILLVGSGQSRNLPCELQSAAREVSVPHGRSYWQYFYQGRIRKVLMEERADVYHLPNTLPFFGKCIPTVVTIHDLVDLRVTFPAPHMQRGAPPPPTAAPPGRCFALWRRLHPAVSPAKPPG